VIAYLYVFDTMADWEAAFLISELKTGRYFKQNLPPCEVKTVALTEDPVLTMGGIRIVPDITVSQCHPQSNSLLILPGGNTWLEPVHAEMLTRAEEFLAAGSVVAAICGATFGLALAGLLNDRFHTSNNLDYLKAICNNYTGEEKYCRKPAVTDGGLITAPGISPLEFACEVFKALDVFEESTLEAWYQLYKTGDAKYYFALMQSVGKM